MTTNEDMLFLEILATALDKNSDVTAEDMMEQFAAVYKEKVDDRDINGDPFIMDIIKQIIPEEFL